MPERLVTAPSERFREPGRVERLRDRLRLPFERFPLRAQLRAVYHRLLWLSTLGRGLPATLPDGAVIRILPEFRYVTWNRDEYDAFGSSLRTGGTALDIGANVGCYAVMFGQRVAPDGHVFAFEPAPTAYRGLARHIALNDLETLVTPVPVAVSDHVGKGRLVTTGPIGTDHLAIATATETGPTTDVEVTTIDAFCERQGIAPDLIKVDVEGVELAVLRGARRTIAASQGTLALFVEMHPSRWPSLGTSKAELLAELAEQGLRVEPLRADGDPWAVEGACVRLLPT